MEPAGRGTCWHWDAPGLSFIGDPLMSTPSHINHMCTFVCACHDFSKEKGQNVFVRQASENISLFCLEILIHSFVQFVPFPLFLLPLTIPKISKNFPSSPQKFLS